MNEEWQDDSQTLLERTATALLDADERADDEIEVDDFGFVIENVFEDFVALAKTTICDYFEGRRWHSGGPIPKKILDSEHYLTVVLNTTISEGVDLAYEQMRIDGRWKKDGIRDQEGVITEDIRTVIALLHDIKAVIPQPFVPGILLMHLELVVGVDMDARDNGS